LDSFRITFVCTGNRFRSPLAEAFVRRLTRGMPVITESYGALPLEDAPPLPEAVEIATACGISLTNHRSRYLNTASLADVDLLLGFEPTHVHQAVVEAQAPRERSFTVRDFIPLLVAAGPAAPDKDLLTRAHSLVALAGDSAARASGLMTTGMRDPFGGTRKVYRQTASEIRDVSITLAQTLFGVSDTSDLPPIPRRVGRARIKLWR
jgi:protein-tyrosine phosphatase